MNPCAVACRGRGALARALLPGARGRVVDVEVAGRGVAVGGAQDRVQPALVGLDRVVHHRHGQVGQVLPGRAGHRAARSSAGAFADTDGDRGRAGVAHGDLAGLGAVSAGGGLDTGPIHRQTACLEDERTRRGPALRHPGGQGRRAVGGLRRGDGVPAAAGDEQPVEAVADLRVARRGRAQHGRPCGRAGGHACADQAAAGVVVGDDAGKDATWNRSQDAFVERHVVDGPEHAGAGEVEAELHGCRVSPEEATIATPGWS